MLVPAADLCVVHDTVLDKNAPVIHPLVSGRVGFLQ